MSDKVEIKSFCSRALKCIENDKFIFKSIGTDSWKRNSNIIEKLFNCKLFEHPDGYFWDKENSILYIFEHFEFDCSPNTKDGSKLRKSEAALSLKEKNEIEKNKPTAITSIIEQGYCNNNTYRIGANGVEYRNNYIKNFEKSFFKHLNQIEKYKKDCINDIGCIPNKVVISFVCEDKTLGGTYYKKNNKMADFVNPLHTKQIINLLKNSSIDYLIFNSVHDSTQLTILAKNSIDDIMIKSAIDLEKSEFFIIPAFPKFSYIKHYN